MTNLFQLHPGRRMPELVITVVEVPADSANKYEYDVERGIFKLDRVLYSPMHYPGDYGFIPGTYAEDEDPLDILVLMDRPTFPGVVVRARPLGYLEMSDEKGRDLDAAHKLILDARAAYEAKFPEEAAAAAD